MINVVDGILPEQNIGPQGRYFIKPEGDYKLPLLEKQKIYLEKKITDSGADINDISHQLAALIESIKEYEDRWIELSELSESAK